MPTNRPEHLRVKVKPGGHILGATLTTMRAIAFAAVSALLTHHRPPSQHANAMNAASAKRARKNTKRASHV